MVGHKMQANGGRLGHREALAKERIPSTRVQKAAMLC